MIESYVQKPSEAFRSLPEIYQVELTNHCNLKCPMCLRTTDMVRDQQHVDRALIKKMIQRGDFAGTAYTELQMAGEPTLHPEFGSIIRDLQQYGVLVGASTHGHTITKKAGVLDALMSLDALTISVDSVDPEVYAKVRYPAKLDALISNIDAFVNEGRKYLAHGGKRPPFTELQLVHMPDERGLGPTGDHEALALLVHEKGWGDIVSTRVTVDCFQEMQGVHPVGSLVRNSGLCVNPWTSVSVMSDGRVVSCCYIFEAGDDSPNSYGSLVDSTLAEVWAGRKVQEMREAQQSGRPQGECTRCYLKSPTLIHQNIIARLVRARC